MAKKSRRREEEQGMSFGRMLKSMLLGSAAGTLLFFALLCALSGLVLKSGLSQSAYPYLGVLLAALSAFVAAIVSVRRIGKNGMVMGIGSALPELLLLVLTVLFTSTAVGMMTAILVLAMLVSSAAGGILAVNMRR